jgi:hypothetical protein
MRFQLASRLTAAIAAARAFAEYVCLMPLSGSWSAHAFIRVNTGHKPEPRLAPLSP